MLIKTKILKVHTENSGNPGSIPGRTSIVSFLGIAQ